MKKVKVKDLHGKALVWVMSVIEGESTDGALFNAHTMGLLDFNLGELIGSR